MGTAYHQEVQRKRRMLERSHAAQQRMAGSDLDALMRDCNRQDAAPTASRNERPVSIFPSIASRAEKAQPQPQRSISAVERVYRPTPQLARIERDNIQQIIHPYDFSTWQTRKSLGIDVVDGAHYYRPRPKSQVFRIPYYSSYIWH